MTLARCGLFARVCLTGIGILPPCAPVMVAHVHAFDMAAARPTRAESPVGRFCFVAAKPGSAVLPATYPPDSVVAAGAPCSWGCERTLNMGRKRGRNSYGGDQTKSFRFADWDAGGLLGHGYFGSSLAVVLLARAPVDPKRLPYLHPEWRQQWRGTSTPRVTSSICHSCSPKGGYNSWHKIYVLALLCR